MIRLILVFALFSWLTFSTLRVVDAQSLGEGLITPADVQNLSQANQQKLIRILPQLQTFPTLYAQGKYQELLPIMQSLSTVMQEVFGSNHRLTAFCKAGLGSVLSQLGRSNEAVPILEQALVTQQRLIGERHLQTAFTLIALGDSWGGLGDVEKSIEFYQRALAIRKGILGEQHEDTARLNYLIGLNRMTQGDFAVARNMIEEAYAVQRIVLDEKNDKIADTISALGLLEMLDGNFLEGRSLIERGLRIRKELYGEQHIEVSRSYELLAMIYRYIGDYPTAIQMSEKSYAICLSSLGEKSVSTISAIESLAECYLETGEMKKSKTLIDQAIRVRSGMAGSQGIPLSHSHLLLGKWHQKNGDDSLALANYQKSSALMQASVGSQSVMMIGSLASTADLLLQRGDYAASRKLLNDGLNLIRSTIKKDTFDLPGTLTALARCDAGENRWQDAIAKLDDARRRVRALAIETLPGLSEREILIAMKHIDEEMRAIALSAAYHNRNDQAVVDASAAWLINGKAMIEETLGMQQARKRNDQETALRSIEDLWIDLSSCREVLPEKSVMIDIAKFKIRNFQSKSKDDQWQPERYVAWVSSADRQSQVRIIDLGDAEEIDQLVSEARKILHDAIPGANHPGTIRELGEEAAAKLLQQSLDKLSKRLLDPLAKELNYANQLLISPDGALWLLPWNALPIKNGRFLIEDYSLQFLVSSRDLLHQEPEELPTTTPILFSDPDYDLDEAQAENAVQAIFRGAIPQRPTESRAKAETKPFRATRLANTAAEAEFIRPSLKTIVSEDPILYTDDFAQEQVFKELHSPRILVLSTHGFFQSDQNSGEPRVTSNIATNIMGKLSVGPPVSSPMLRCGLLLAGCNRSADSPKNNDGVLTGKEITNTDLQGTQIVVLSACETGVGDIRAGDGVAGLRQAFHLAGAKSVIASLWQVPDRESMLVVSEFFNGLSNGKSEAEALRQSQIKRIASRREKFGAAHPYYWGAWMVTGDSGRR